ncbi:MAG: DNA-methyltransferase [Desulfobacterales bacterium]
MKGLFFEALEIKGKNGQSVQEFARQTGIPVERLRYYNNYNKLPTGNDMKLIYNATGINKEALMLKMGLLDSRLSSVLRENADQIYSIISSQVKSENERLQMPAPAYETGLGRLYQGDSLDLMKNIDDDTIDLIFADPPFNLKKLYPSNIDDDLKSDQYLRWCEKWADECIRILRPGGSLFVWNLPKWNTYISAYLNDRLTFRHWIAVDIKYSLPIKGRLYPSHYSLLYYCKGDKPNRFHPDRLPMSICPHCSGDLKDYGGYKHKMNPDGVNLTDVWLDIPPVRHKKYKRRNGSNELSIKLLDRIIELASVSGDLIFDPFGGSGTTYAVSEIKNRRWIGIEIGPVDDIINRIENIDEDRAYLNKIRQNINCLISDEDLEKRIENSWWTPASVRKKVKERLGYNT